MSKAAVSIIMNHRGSYGFLRSPFSIYIAIIFIEFEETSYTVTEGTDPSVEVCIDVVNPSDLEAGDSFEISLVAETGSDDTAQGASIGETSMTAWCSFNFREAHIFSLDTGRAFQSMIEWLL